MERQVILRGDAMPGGPPRKQNTELRKGCGMENTPFFEPFILRGSAKRSYLKNNLISLLDLDKRLILGTENKRKWPNTENPHIEFQSPACKLESLTVTIQTCVLVVLESSGVELQRTEKGAEDIWEDNQRSEQKEGRKAKESSDFPSSSCDHARCSLLKTHCFLPHTEAAKTQG